VSKLSRGFFHFVLLGHTPAEALRLAGGFLLSLGAHVVAAILLMLLPLMSWFDDEPIPPIEMEIIEPEPEVVPEPEPEPEPEPDTEPELPAPDPEPVVQRPTPTRAPPPPSEEPPPTEEPPPAEETAADFTGMTLTNDQGAAWNSATGNGAEMDGPVGRPGAVVTGRNRRGVQGGTPGGRGSAESEEDQLVPASDLSRRPAPPGSRLIELLRQNYPREARNLGLEGSARVRVRVEADGRVRVLGVVSEDHDGFGQACRATLRQGGRWEPPLDRGGDAVATITTFRCTFTVDF